MFFFQIAAVLVATVNAGLLTFPGIVPVAPIATKFHPSPYTVVTPPLFNGILGTNALNFYSSVVPSVELQVPILPQLHTIAHNSIEKPVDNVLVTFKEAGDKIIHNVDGEKQNFQFTHPSNEAGFASYGLPAKNLNGPPQPFVPSTSIVVNNPNFLQPSLLPSQASLPNIPSKIHQQSPPTIFGSAPLIFPQIPTHTGHIHLPENTRVSIVDDKNQYTNGYSLDDGTKVTEQGKLISTDDGWEYVIAKTGSYQYVSPEGTPVHVKWIADENGFRIL